MLVLESRTLLEERGKFLEARQFRSTTMMKAFSSVPLTFADEMLCFSLFSIVETPIWQHSLC